MSDVAARASEWLENPAALQPAKALVRDLLAALELAQQENASLSRGANDAFKERAWKAESALHRLREVAAPIADFAATFDHLSDEHAVLQRIAGGFTVADLRALRAELAGGKE